MKVKEKDFPSTGTLVISHTQCSPRAVTRCRKGVRAATRSGSVSAAQTSSGEAVTVARDRVEVVKVAMSSGVRG